MIQARHLAAAFWGFAEATLFFVVPDVLIGWIALRRGLRAAVVAALLAALGAGLGGAAIWQWSARDPAGVERAIEALPAIPPGAVAAAQADMLKPDWRLTALKGAFGNRPFKLFAAAAPRAGVSLTDFAASGPLIRLPRFVLVALAFAAIGLFLRRRLTPGTLLALHLGGWTLFYAVFWTLSAW